MYIKKSNVISALSRMQEFESSLKALYDSFGLSLRENSGRRNILLSQAQESFFADELRNEGYSVSCSGRTGEPDIVIDSLGRELECKLTSSAKRSWPLQCDYTTLKKKGSTDFLYVLACESFDNFAVLFFKDLTVDDFHPPASGSREKSRMNKKNAMKKCTVLHGTVSDRTPDRIQENLIKLEEEVRKTRLRLESLRERKLTARTQKSAANITRMINNETKRSAKKVAKIESRISYWESTGPQYEIRLGPAR